ncbi:unnamed protein product [Cylicocyclus nassatus]|uniref:Uncharacterized protein n=1 Tax=Cylicocyclus nassatus TaxID=53992 RepID=A0AA36HC78_CYLNA|nr:unnamed protein product [Cylicocyclus nassatus]
MKLTALPRPQHVRTKLTSYHCITTNSRCFQQVALHIIAAVITKNYKQPSFSAVMALLQKTLLFIAVWNQVEALKAADFTFGQFCNRPPNFGTGILTATDICEVTYNVELDNDVAAANFCEQQHPYSLKSFGRNGAKTICTIGSYFKCKESEVLIDKTCYLLKEDKAGVDILDAVRSGCGSRHTVHKFKSQFEQKWVATFFTKHPMLWIANSPADSITKHLKFALRKEILVSKNGRMREGNSTAMVIVTSARTHTKIPRGSIVMARTDLSMPVLCSRPAEELSSYVPALMEKFSELGLKSYIKKDKRNNDRPFFILREYSSFDMSEEKGEKGKFAVGTKRLHKGCSAFLNGYAASPLDFRNVEDFKKILEEENVNIVSVPGRRFRNPIDSSSECKPKQVRVGARSDFKFDLPNGASQETSISDSHWAPDHPNRACSDTPRIALGFAKEKGSVDIPATARHFTLCTYGTAPPRSDPSLRCHFAATYDKKNNRCVCNVAGNDYGKQTRFDKTIDREAGELCVECELEAWHAVVIVVHLKNAELSTAFLKIVPQIMSPFIMTESYITTIFYGSCKRTQYKRYALAKDGKNFDYWRDVIKKEALQCVGNGYNFPNVYFDASYFQRAPPHRRILILMTGEEYKDVEKKLKEERSAWNVNKVFVFASKTTNTKAWPETDQKVYIVDSTKQEITRETWKAISDISQQAAMNVCLREKE